MTESPGKQGTKAPNEVTSASASLIARRGVRGATIRDVAADVGVPLSTLFQAHGGKERLLQDGFRLGIAADAAAFGAMQATAGALGVQGTRSCGDLLWMLCEPACPEERERLQLLTELLLQAPHNSSLRPLAREWLLNRRDAVRALVGQRPGAVVSDILVLMHLAETAIAAACCGSHAWRLVGRQIFLQAGTRLGAWHGEHNPGAIAEAAELFHSDPEVSVATSPDRGQLRQQMIEAAAEIIVESGIAAVTNRAVAERAGSSLAATTYHFRSISDLVLAAVLHIFAASRRVAGSGSLGTGPGGIAAWIAGRKAPSASERAGTFAFVEIALAASRGQLPPELGLTIRRHRGTITHARLQARGYAIGRDRTVAAANWFTGVYLASAALDDAEALFDFDAQAEVVGHRIFGFQGSSA